MKIKNVLISLYDKSNIETILKVLNDYNVNIYASSSTCEHINSLGYSAKPTSEITGINELINGRVKTLNEKLFAGILARKGVDKCEDIPVLFDLVIVDLYPFEKTLTQTKEEEQLIEMIDIGGVSLIRAAAKNYKYVTIICKKEDYEPFVEHIIENDGQVLSEYSKMLAGKAFNFTYNYDKTIAEYFLNKKKYTDNSIEIGECNELRYGENPHQKAKICRIKNVNSSIYDFDVIHGKKMSYNNYMDADAALNIVNHFSEPCCAIIKHTNPCGVAIGETISEAYELAYIADTQSAYGSIVALNRVCDLNTARLIKGKFVEVLIAPDFEQNALELLMSKKNIRLIKGEYKADKNHIRHINGALLIQDRDNTIERIEDFEIVSSRKPTDREFRAMIFAWNVVRFVKSNAIVIANDKRTMGIGAGQMSRVDAVDIAVKKSGGNAAYTGGSALASDGFFPFRDSIDKAYKAGIYAIIEPGGSIRDSEIINACNELDMALIFTHKRHFLH